ncbi:STAS domain-containing protein [Streptomyces sp. ISID311]|uniref:STAS domain-containing protein n=1 Tax=Streptomyces sp. ISID311 TaxID=2601673 RepID=UPI0011BD3217|nr:STAS domain-containing protein [Streptomyces sp. ISID311]TXC98482.1 STAS domain-containing protein [Streptomyces sp. ISID311]
MVKTDELSVEVSVIDLQVAVVVVQGELDTQTGTLLHHQLANQLVHGRQHLVLDLRAVPFMDSSGLSVLIRAGNDTKRVEGSLRLAAASPEVRRLLDLTGISVSMPVHASPEEALFAIAAASLPEGAASGPEAGTNTGG